MGPALATVQAARIDPDLARVVTRLFVPGQELVGGGESRASGAVARVLALDEDTVRSTIAEVIDRFAGRHRDLTAVFENHAERIMVRVEPGIRISPARRQLLGAVFTHEYAIEGAAVCNPSIVAHPDQQGVAADCLRVVLSVRGIGEGHCSSIGFRTGTVDALGGVTLDAPGPYPELAAVQAATNDRAVFHARLAEMGRDGESAAYVLDPLGERFSEAELEGALTRLWSERDTRRNAPEIISSFRSIAARSYTARFDPQTQLSERVLFPAVAAEARGIEDARFVRLEGPGAPTYYATCTAFDGIGISQQLLETADFATFTSSPLAGRAAANKGLALFPRLIDGRYAALSRHDRETNAVTFSDNPRRWDEAVPLQVPTHPYDVVQVGNCGSPIELEQGWLMLTHSVGAMRTYTLGALLLDHDDPTAVIGHVPEPLLVPTASQRDGYVPNVVYSCGALLHNGHLILPFGTSDRSISIASIPIDALTDAIEPITPWPRPGGRSGPSGRTT